MAKRKRKRREREEPYEFKCTPGDVTIEELPGIFGFEKWRDGQVETIYHLHNGIDTLMTFKTGGGKSAVYMGAGLIRGGLTVVLFPLKSLINDQFRRFRELGIPARVWDGDVSDAYKRETLKMIADHDDTFFLLTTPESTRSRILGGALRGCVNTLVIDEAHKILEDRGFRPAYASIGRIVLNINPRVKLCCTATLTKRDQSVVINTARLKDPKIVQLEVDRPNLKLHLVSQSFETMMEIIERHQGQAGIIFFSTVSSTRAMHKKLDGAGWNPAVYTGAGASKRDKQENQDQFMSGEKNIMCATNAFGLGIDREDIRWIIHYDIPQSIEQWVQEYGRAGRDDKESHIYGMFRNCDKSIGTRKFLINQTYPPVHILEKLWHYLLSAPFRDDTADGLMLRAFDKKEPYSGGAAISALKKKELVEVTVNPEHKGRRRYRAKGVFKNVDWRDYIVEHHDTMNRFAKLVEVVGHDEGELTGLIHDYFTASEPVEVQKSLFA